MCGRYIVVSKLDKIEKKFGVTKQTNIPFQENFNVSPGDLAPVITQEDPQSLQMFRFGLRPFWSKKPMYLINARSEGDRNKENDPNYHGSLEISKKPSFRKPIRSQRCLVLADAFIEGTTMEKLSKPYVVYPVDKSFRPFAFAGIYDRWIDKESGEVIDSFSIITAPATPLLRKIPHHRSPVVLADENERKAWLEKDTSMAEVESLLRLKNELAFNAYPIDNQIKNPRIKDRSLIEPIGERILKEYEYVIHKDIELFGMGQSPARKRKLEE